MPRTYSALGEPMGHWECPRCGQDVELASKRSLWSLFPFVCVHRAVDYSSIIDELTRDNKTTIHALGYEWCEVYRKPIPCRESGLRRRLRERLSQSLQDRRPAWWLPLYSALALLVAVLDPTLRLAAALSTDQIICVAGGVFYVFLAFWWCEKQFGMMPKESATPLEDLR